MRKIILLVLVGCGGASGAVDGAPVAARASAVEDAGAVAETATPDAGPCYELPVTTYCPADSTTAYWCHSAPGLMTSPGAGCAPLGFGDWDGGDVVAGQWCCR